MEIDADVKNAVESQPPCSSEQQETKVEVRDGPESVGETMDSQPSTSNAKAEDPESQQEPVCIILLGMAGSGKTSLCSKLIEHLFSKKQMPYVINCDPACQRVDYMCNIDIRDTINYKNVMSKYQLGPNGSIITSLNLFVTNFDQVLTLIDKRKDNYKFVYFCVKRSKCC